jgi:hypothetical protein
MAKRKRVLNERVIQRRQKEGRGKGRGADYQPWLQIQDVPSQGLATRVKGWKTGRCHHFLSQLECQYFYQLEWASQVSDIREQYPLELDRTLALGERLGIKHPTDPRTREPVVMTTDFVVTIRLDGKLVEQARCLKYAQELVAERTIEKLEIERLYWNEQYVDWGIVTEHEMEPILAANVAWVHPYRAVMDLVPVTGEVVRRVTAVLTPAVQARQAPLRELTDACDDQLGCAPGMSLTVVRHLIANQHWLVEMKQPINPAQPLGLLATPPAATSTRRKSAGRKAGRS